jgi:hypothetical protein
MKKYIIFFLIFSLTGCAPKTYTFRGKKVTEKQLNRKLHRFTVRYVKKNPEFVQLWEGVEVVYDTTKN